ncbi:hypothetical protein DYB26_004914 [Aphanomyces astaci]|uniref:Uncharacterized protein n=1 Tax=Aphanomyces astaci TaxID=112090 RepID=A0A3R6ZYC3_APHAT|nr:hypothetical protein DYB26_004914 [Aphanomyces astaci]
MTQLERSVVRENLSLLGKHPITNKHIFTRLDVKHNLTAVDVLKDFPYLQDVDVANNQIESLAALAHLPFLISLNAENNHLTTLLAKNAWVDGQEAIGPMLHIANFARNSISVMRDLKTHRYIQELILDHNHITEVTGISELVFLKQRNCKPATDYHTLVYPLLQAAKHFDNGRELLVPWTAFPGLLRFDVVETNDAGVCDTVVGSTTPLPLVRFIQGDEATLTLPLVLCHSNSTNSSLSTPSSTSLTVRLKVQLPDPNPTPHKQPDGAARPADKKWSTYVRDALAEKDAKAATLGTTLFGAFWKAKDTTTMVQNAVGRVCATVVCTQNLFNWTHPWKTATVFAACVGGAILFSIVQARNTARNVLWNFISSLPTDTDLIQAYDDQRKEYVATRTSAEVADAVACRRLKLQALWVGTVQVKMEHDRTWKRTTTEHPPQMARTAAYASISLPGVSPNCARH